MKVEDSPIQWDCEKLAKEIVAQSKRKSAPNRLLYISNDKLHKKADKVSKTGISETELFSQILTLRRKAMKHRGITVVKVGDKDWLNVKETAALAKTFCDEFGLDSHTGFNCYIMIGLSMMKNFSLNKFKGLHQAICKRYECEEELDLDPHPNETEELYILYTNKVNEKVGFSTDYKTQPDKYVGFKRAVDTAKELKVSLKVFLKAQFFALEWANGIPDPLQLYGDKAKERVVKYAYENNIEVREKPQIDLKKLRRKKYDKNLD